jgi:hypothetical protein
MGDTIDPVTRGDPAPTERPCYGGGVSLIFRSALIDLLQRRADEVAVTVAHRIDVQHGHRTLTPVAEIEQLVRVTFPLLTEALEGGTEVRQLHLGMIVPSVLASGVGLSLMIHEGYRVWMYILTDLVVRLPEGLRDAASGWLTDFIVGWMREVEAHAIGELTSRSA